MKKLFLLSLTALSILLLPSCSSGVSQEEYDSLLSENTSLKSKVESLPSGDPSNDTLEEQSSDESSDIKDNSWDFIVNNYPLVTYDEIKANSFNEQYVILPATIDTVEYSKTLNWVSCDVWFDHNNAYVSDNITFHCDELSNYSPESLQIGDNVDICFYINADNSFGSTIKGFEKNDSLISLDEIYNSFKQNCTPMDWESIMRSPESFWGTTYSFTGRVFQVISSRDNYTELLLSTSNDEIIHVSHFYKENDLKILEDDTLTIYGTFYKLYEYTSVLGINQSVPSISAEFIDIN